MDFILGFGVCSTHITRTHTHTHQTQTDTLFLQLKSFERKARNIHPRRIIILCLSCILSHSFVYVDGAHAANFPNLSDFAQMSDHVDSLKIRTTRPIHQVVGIEATKKMDHVSFPFSFGIVSLATTPIAGLTYRYTCITRNQMKNEHYVHWGTVNSRETVPPHYLLTHSRQRALCA